MLVAYLGRMPRFCFLLLPKWSSDSSQDVPLTGERDSETTRASTSGNWNAFHGFFCCFFKRFRWFYQSSLIDMNDPILIKNP